QDRGAVDNAAAALGVHGLERGARHAEHAIEVDVDDAQEVLVRIVLRRAQAADTGVVEDAVEPPEPGHRLVHQAVDLFGGRDIDRDEHAVARVAGIQLGGSGRPGGAGDVGDHHLGPFGQAALHRGQPDAAGPTGDDNNLVLQTHGNPPE